MADNLLKRITRYLFPSADDKFNAGMRWAASEIKDLKTAAELDNWENMQPLCANDPFDRGVLRAVTAHMAAINPQPGPTGVPAWAQGPRIVSSPRALRTIDFDDLIGKTFQVKVNTPVKPRVRVKAGRRVI